MFYHHDLKGKDLPEGTLCLTYDDGPGPQTVELGHYLWSEGISATFFVLGQSAATQLDVLSRLSSWGHRLGNHTYSHPGLVALAESQGDVVREIVRTEALLRMAQPLQGSPRYLRPPYGNWRRIDRNTGREDDTSIVATILNQSDELPHYVGPVHWDISAADYDYWRRGATPQECAAATLKKIREKDRGIVLMHDSSEDASLRARNRAGEVTQILVPILKGSGYQFVDLPRILSCARHLST